MADVKVFIFCDALGFSMAEKFRFMAKEFPYRYKVRTQFGYSSTAVPTILTGAPPREHGQFSFFFYDRENKSPFKIFRYIHWLLHPAWFFDNHRIRRRIGLLLKKFYGFTGYFNLYKVPYKRLPYLDYCEKHDLFAAHGTDPVPNLRDMFAATGRRFHISDWRRSDDFNLAEAAELLRKGQTDILFVYTAGIDGMLHFHVGDDAYVKRELERYADKVRSLFAAARSAGRTFAVSLFSDHGMAPLKGTYDLKKRLESGPFRWGRDFIACYDSTMVRLWFRNPEAREFALRAFDGVPGHYLSCDEKVSWGIDFDRDKYGEAIFLIDAGYQIAPGDMGDRGIPGMHGFSPDDEWSDACFLGSEKPAEEPHSIADFFRVMRAACSAKTGALK